MKYYLLLLFTAIVFSSCHPDEESASPRQNRSLNLSVPSEQIEDKDFLWLWSGAEYETIEHTDSTFIQEFKHSTGYFIPHQKASLPNDTALIITISNVVDISQIPTNGFDRLERFMKYESPTFRDAKNQICDYCVTLSFVTKDDEWKSYPTSETAVQHTETAEITITPHKGVDSNNWYDGMFKKTFYNSKNEPKLISGNFRLYLSE